MARNALTLDLFPWPREPRAQRIVGSLLAIDLLLIGWQLIEVTRGGLPDHWTWPTAIESMGVFQAFKFLAIALFLVGMTAQHHVWRFLPWSLLFTFLALEASGPGTGWFGDDGSNRFQVMQDPGWQRGEFSELWITLGMGCLVMPMLIYSYRSGGVEFRRAVHRYVILLGGYVASALVGQYRELTGHLLDIQVGWTESFLSGLKLLLASLMFGLMATMEGSSFSPRHVFRRRLREDVHRPAAEIRPPMAIPSDRGRPRRRPHHQIA